MTTTTLTTAPPSNPPAFYTVNNALDPDAVDTTALRAAEYRFWKRKADVLNPERDCDALASSLSRVTGKPRRYNYNAINALLTLAELPRLQALQEELFHLDLHRLQAIDRALAPADATTSRSSTANSPTT
ncbi:hypothetical protein [Corynebacterium halotolerans]|uniref:hypothetical protein n=1 Tax=Corynebacterium halotolerans TaxID=225326 RepID=UPI0003496014|nr:hypothetical protein [Corynebacterium halotolerans]